MTNMKVDFDTATSMIRAGKVVALPTETVYGLAASMEIEAAVNDIYRLKKRSRNKPLTVNVASLDDVLYLTNALPPFAAELIDAFWPGPLTLILPANLERVPASVRANGGTVGIRIPNHPLTLDLIRECGPIVLPSANIEGEEAPISASNVSFDVLDGGDCKVGIESTILEYFDGIWNIRRKGAISDGQIIEKMRQSHCDRPLLYAANLDRK